MIPQINDSNKEVYIFGTGELGKQAYAYLINKGFKVVAFIDNNKNKWGSKLFDISIISIDSINNIKNIFIVIASSWYEEISIQLERIGFPQDSFVYYNYLFGIMGEFNSWVDASKQSIGYDSDEIIQKVATSVSKVKNGEAVFERDSVIFDKPDYSLGLITSLLYIANKNNGHLHVLDFGGSLGSTYYECRNFFDSTKIKWNIVEQEKIVNIGKQNFLQSNLNFYNSIEECLEKETIDVIVFSGALQYISNYEEIISDALNSKVNYILIDKVYLSENEENRIAIQNVNPQIYNASYPVWVFSRKKILNLILKNFEIFMEFKSNTGILIDKNIEDYEGILFERKWKGKRNV